MELLAQIIQHLTVMALPFLFAVTLHEAGHALAAYRLGDPTAKLEGRLSLNPLVHLDPVGTVLIPLAAIVLNFPFLIGYAKPVPIQPRYFKKIRSGIVLVALAGPIGNLLVGLFFAIVWKLAIMAGFTSNDWLYQTARWGVILNSLFMVFNLLPIPPLDGASVVEQFLPHDMAQSYRAAAPFGFFILMAIVVVANEIISVPTNFVAQTLISLVGLG